MSSPLFIPYGAFLDTLRKPLVQCLFQCSFLLDTFLSNSIVGPQSSSNVTQF